MYNWPERALVFGPLVLDLLGGLVGDGLLQLLQMLRELVQLAALVGLLISH